MDSIRLRDKKDKFLLEINGTRINNVVGYKVENESGGLFKIELSLAYTSDDVDLEITLD